MNLPVTYDLLSPSEKREARKLYVEKQKNLCYHCKGRLDLSPREEERLYTPINWKLFPGGKEGFLKYPVHLHHCHKTGLTLGAVHSFCNAWLWYYKGE